MCCLIKKKQINNSINIPLGLKMASFVVLYSRVASLTNHHLSLCLTNHTTYVCKLYKQYSNSPISYYIEMDFALTLGLSLCEHFFNHFC